MAINFINIWVKYWTIVISSNYLYTKLLGYNNTVKFIAMDFVFALLLSFLVSYVRQYFAPSSIPIMVVFCLIYKTLLTNTKLELSITVTVLAFGISYTFYFVSSLITATALKLSTGVFLINNLICFLCISLVQFFIIRIPFKFRRFRKGMPFLQHTTSNNTGVLISVVLLCGAILFTSGKNADLIFLIPVVLILICGVLTLFWWRGRTTKAYLERLRTDEIRCLNDAILEKQLQIKNLEHHNEELAKIIHRDNKLIPVMELAVRECLLSCEQADINSVQKKGTELLAQLETMSRERAGIIKEYQLSSKKLPSTNVISIDSLISYMFNKAGESNIEFEFTVTASLKYLTESIITIPDLNTLLADLIENAIIATKVRAKKNILVSINIDDCFYSIDIFDSGIPFKADTLLNLGQKKVTTHANDGGSGIGIMTAFELLNKYHASLFIEEFPENNSIFTKKVSIRFDGKNQYIVKTVESEKIQVLAQRADLSLVTI